MAHYYGYKTNYSPSDHMRIILSDIGIPNDIINDVLTTKLDDNASRIVLEYLAYVQKDETFKGNSDLAINEALKRAVGDWAFRGTSLEGIGRIEQLNDIMNDAVNKPIGQFTQMYNAEVYEQRLDDGYYEMTEEWQADYRQKFEKEYYI